MKLNRWFGLRNTTTEERLRPGDLAAAKNVDLDDTGKIRPRAGYELLRSGSTHSIWSYGTLCLFVNDRVLYRLHSDLVTVTALKTLTSNRPMSFTEVGTESRVLFSNGIDKGQVVNGAYASWGAEPPRLPVAVPHGGGGLAAGTYQYAVTWVSKDPYSESGAGLVGSVDVENSGSIEFLSIETSTSAEIGGKILYLSGPGGDVLYRAAVLAPEATSFWYRGGGLDLGTDLKTQFCYPPPTGDIVEYWNAHAFVVGGDVAWHSEPYSPEHFKLATAFTQFPGRLSMYAAVDDGIYASWDGATVFLSGSSPEKFLAREVLPYGAIARTTSKCDAAAFAEGAEGRAVVFTTPRGVCVGFNGGAISNLTEDTFTFPSAGQGAGIVRTVNGYSQYVSVLQG